MQELENKIQLISVKSETLKKVESVTKLRQVIAKFILANKNPIIFYKAGNPDGMAAAFLMREHINRLLPVNVLTKPIRQNENVTDIVDNDLIVFLDVCPTVSDVASIINIDKSILVLDYHESAFDNISKNINNHIENMSKPSFFVFSEDSMNTAAQLSYILSDTAAHSVTIDAIGNYDRRDFSYAKVETSALGILMKSRLASTPADKLVDVVGVFINSVPDVIFKMALKFYDHHQSVIVALAANAFNNANVIRNDSYHRVGILLTADKNQFIDVAELMLVSGKELNLVCGICLVGDTAEFMFITKQTETSKFTAIDYAVPLGGGGSKHNAEYICHIDQIAGTVERIKEAVLANN